MFWTTCFFFFLLNLHLFFCFFSLCTCVLNVHAKTLQPTIWVLHSKRGTDEAKALLTCSPNSTSSCDWRLSSFVSSLNSSLDHFNRIPGDVILQELLHLKSPFEIQKLIEDDCRRLWWASVALYLLASSARGQLHYYCGEYLFIQRQRHRVLS